jgi:hypothetical protein
MRYGIGSGELFQSEREPEEGTSLPALVHERDQPILKTKENRSKIFDLPPARPIIDGLCPTLRKSPRPISRNAPRAVRIAAWAAM